MYSDGFRKLTLQIPLNENVKIMNNEIVTYSVLKKYVTGNCKLTFISLIVAGKVFETRTNILCMALCATV